MAHASTRVTRKKIREPDQFLTLLGQALEFFEKYKKACLLGLAAVLVLALASTGWSLYRDRQDQLAAAKFDDALRLFHLGNFREAVAAFETVKSYSSSTFTTYALLYEADSYLAMNEPEKAVKALQEVVAREKKSSIIRQLALMTLGYAHEVRSEWKQAAESYGAAEKIDGPYKEDSLLSKARCEMEAKDYKAALDSYKSYLSTNPNGARSTEAALKVQELEGMLKEKVG